jgi:3-methyladenine DNA glycosylase AlkD
MAVAEIMKELESYGSESTKKVLLKHGIKEPFFGVKIEHLKTIVKRVKMDYNLSKELFATGNADAMYLAGLIADDAKMTKEDLNEWVKMAVSQNISEYTVPWVAAGSRFGMELALEWIDAKEEHIIAAGWSTLSGIVALKPDNELDLKIFKNLIERIKKQIHTGKNREKYTMMGFLSALGVYVAPLTQDVADAVAAIGPVTVDMNGTACKVPNPMLYIQKVIDRGTLGKKKKTVKC